MGDQIDASESVPVSPDGVDDIPTQEATDKNNEVQENINTDDDIISESSSSDDEDEFEDAKEEETEVEELDAAALLAFSKSRLEKESPTKQPPAPQTEKEAVVDDTDAGNKSPVEEKKIDDNETEEADDEPVVKDQAYFIELAMKKSREAEIQAKKDDDPSYLMKLAEKKLEEANAKAKLDEEAMGENVIKPVIPSGPKRSENAEMVSCYNIVHVICTVLIAIEIYI